MGFKTGARGEEKREKEEEWIVCVSLVATVNNFHANECPPPPPLPTHTHTHYREEGRALGSTVTRLNLNLAAALTF